MKNLNPGFFYGELNGVPEKITRMCFKDISKVSISHLAIGDSHVECSVFNCEYTAAACFSFVAFRELDPKGSFSLWLCRKHVKEFLELVKTDFSSNPPAKKPR